MNRYQKTMNNLKPDRELLDKTYAEIENKRNSKRKIPKPYYALVTVLMVMVIAVAVFPKQTEVSAAAYISLDINPSIQLVIDENNKVIGIEAYNDEGKYIIDGIEYEEHDYLEICKEIITSEQFKKYCGDNSTLLVTVTSNGDYNDAYIRSLKDMIEEYYANGIVKSCDSKYIEAAKDADMSIGKYHEYAELNSLDDSYTIEVCRDMSIEEIHDEIVLHHSESHNQSGTHHEGHHD